MDVPIQFRPLVEVRVYVGKEPAGYSGRKVGADKGIGEGGEEELMDMLRESDQAELVADGAYEIGERSRGGKDEWIVHCLTGDLAVVSPDDGLIRKSLSKVMLSDHDGA